MSRLVIIGCDGFGREVSDLVTDLSSAGTGHELLGFIDDSPTPENRGLAETRGLRILGPFSWFEDADSHDRYVIGNPGTCHRIDLRHTEMGSSAERLIHTQATVGSDVTVDEGTIIRALAGITTYIARGQHVHICRRHANTDPVASFEF